MRFGLFYQASEAPGQTHADRYAEMFDLIALGDTLGFDVAWLAELHFGGAFSLLASPLMMVPVIAQRTRRIRIGTAVTLLPLPHPLRSAEQAAPADPRRRPHRRELRAHRRSGAQHLFRDDDHALAAAPGVHGALSRSSGRCRVRVAARSDGADAARAPGRDGGRRAGRHAARRGEV